MDASNPYAAPLAAVGTDTTHRLPLHHAGRWRRFFNWTIDKIAITCVGGVVGVVIALVGGEAAISRLEGMNRWEEYLFGLPIYVAYYVVMEGVFGITLGKLCTGTRVVDERGEPIRFRHALLRSLCRLIPFDALSVLMSDDKVVRGWHDSIPGTHVVLRRARATDPVEATASTASEMA
jgi:uncharacterized RDD family membrane protein YckC